MPSKGRHWKLSKETKEKIGIANRGKKHIISDETKLKISLTKKGRTPKNFLFFRKKGQDAIRGKKQSKEHIEKRVSKYRGKNHWLFGKNHTSETKQKIGNFFRGKPISQEHKEKIRKTIKSLGLHPPLKYGKNHWNWKGGKTNINHKIRNSLEYRLWRSAVFERDNYTCVWCNARSKANQRVILHADHIKPFAFFPELRFAIDNGRTLCINCHKKTNTYKTKKSAV